MHNDSNHQMATETQGAITRRDSHCGVDLELAQVLGACKSFLPTNEPEYSNVNVSPSSAEILASYFIQACYGHMKW
jgi:hypothetical protein